MFKNYLKIAILQLIKNKTYSLVNIVGPALGITCFILVFLWARHQINFERFHQNAERIYQVNRLLFNTDVAVNFQTACVATQIGPLPVNDFPEIEQVVRLYHNSQLLWHADRFFQEGRFWYVDPNFLMASNMFQ